MLTTLLATVLLLCAATVSAASNPGSTTKPFQRSGNAAYTWWTGPLAATAPGSYYFTGISSQGKQRVYQWSKGRMTYETVGSTRPDDHNAPALSVEPGHPTLVFYTGHPGTMMMRSAASDRPALNTKRPAFGAPVPMPFDQRTTYAQVLRHEGRVVVLSRYLEEGLSGWYFVTSTDSGATWSEPTELFNSEDRQAYILVKEGERIEDGIDVFAYWHPKYGPDNRIGHRRILFSDFFRNEDRLEAFTIDGMTPVWHSQQEDRTQNEQIRLLDGGTIHGRPVALVATWDASAPTPYYRALVPTDESAGGPWEVRPIRSSGGTYGSSNGNYVGGVYLDQRPGAARIYISYQRSRSQWRLISADLTADARPTAWRLIYASKNKLIRPVATGKYLMFMRPRTYAHYTRYFTQIYTIKIP